MATLKTIAPDKTYIDYFQKMCTVRKGLTNRFGIRVEKDNCASLVEISDGQPFTFGKEYPLPVAIETLPRPVRMVIEDHELTYPGSDLRDVLTGRISFQDALASPVDGELKRATAKPGGQFE